MLFLLFRRSLLLILNADDRLERRLKSESADIHSLNIMNLAKPQRDLQTTDLTERSSTRLVGRGRR